MTTAILITWSIVLIVIHYGPRIYRALKVRSTHEPDRRA